MPRAYGYVRANTTDQLNNSGAQRQAIREHFESRLKGMAFSWGGFFEDVATSGGLPLCSRPQGKILDSKLEPGDIVVFTMLDSGFCGLRDGAEVVERWLARGVHLHVVHRDVDTSTPIGRLFVNLLPHFAKLNRSWFRERMADSIAYRRSQGRPAGGSPPYGFKITGPLGKRRFLPDPDSRRIGRHVVRYRQRGYTWVEIYWGLVRDSIRTRRGKEWSIGALRRAFMGDLRFMAEDPEGRRLLKEWAANGAGKTRSGGLTAAGRE
jgi:DNA invertase Pin-like site-specific DNA recombinase